MLMLFLKDVLMLPDDFVFRFDTKACSHSSPKVSSFLSPHSSTLFLSLSLLSPLVSVSLFLLQSNKIKY